MARELSHSFESQIVSDTEHQRASLQSRGSGTRIVSSFDQTGLDERRWNALAALGTNSVFQTHQWHRCWWDTYGRHYEPLLVTVRNGQDTTGVAPFYVEKSARGRVVRFMGEGRADYCDVLADSNPETVAAMVRGLRDYGNWDVLDLGGIPSQSRTVPLLRSLCQEAGFRVMVRPHFVCPTLVVRGNESSVHRLVNKPSLRRRQNYFDRIGRLTFRDLRGAPEIEPYLDTLFDQHTARWNDSGRSSLFDDEINRTFYRDLTRRLDGTDWLLFSIVELDERPIALHYGFDYNDAVIWYKPSFDPAFAAGSPGLVLVRHLIGRVLESGRRELDFTIGDEPFKRRFTNVVRQTVNVLVFRDPALYVLEWSRHEVMAAVRKAAAHVRGYW